MLREQVATLPQQSTACHVSVTTLLHALPVLTLLRSERVTLVPQHTSLAVGGGQKTAVPHCTVWFGPQPLKMGGWLSTTLTVCEQVMEFEQQSVLWESSRVCVTA